MIANVPDALVVIDEQAATIADLRQQLADQQRDFNAKMLSVCDELAHCKGHRAMLEADLHQARRWASAWKRSAKMCREYSSQYTAQYREAVHDWKCAND